MAKFVENNRDELLEKLSEKQLLSLIGRVPLYPTGNREHDRVSYLINKLREMQRAGQEKGDISDVVQEELKELIEQMPEEQRSFMQYCPEMMGSLTKSIAQKLGGAYEGLFRKEDKSLDKRAMVKYLIDNYKVAEDFLDDTNKPANEKLSEGEKASIWDKNLKTQYLEIARELLGSEKKKYKRDKDEDKENRKDKAKSLGLAV